ncbi:hypothetical protein ABMY26_21165 [Azospirillum sp. HJ39]|uniref:hypothetical protein n=1 Tax=Azospirillum sp. HJ39 TaxID=3159496 RepID=UPI0035562B51
MAASDRNTGGRPDREFGIPGSEEAGVLGTGARPPHRHVPPQPPETEGLEESRPEDRIVTDRNVAVDGARDRK